MTVAPEHRIFCFTCKRHVVVVAEGRNEALARFRASGHSDRKVAALAPNVGRVSQRYQRAIARRPAPPEVVVEAEAA